MDTYIYKSGIYCEKHAEDIKQSIFAVADSIDDVKPLNDSDHFPQGPFPNGGGEADIPQHCTSCGKFLENPLTDDGRAYVIGLIEACGLQHSAIVEWINFYGIHPLKQERL